MIASWGVTHPPSLGANRENSVRAVITELLPSTLCIGTGFIINDEQQMSHQCDIIIDDDQIIPPLYRDADIVVLRHITVAMVIEVKTTLSKTELNDALFNIAVAKTVAPHITGCILGFVGPARATATAKGWFEQFHQKGIYIPRKRQRYSLTPETWADYIYAIRGRGKRQQSGFVAKLHRNTIPLQLMLHDCHGVEDIFWFYQFILQHTLISDFPCQKGRLRDFGATVNIERLEELVDIARWLHIEVPKPKLTLNLS